MNSTPAETVEQAARLDAEDLGGDAFAYFITGFKRGSIWQSQQPMSQWIDKDSEGWIDWTMPITPYSGEYEVKDSDGNVFNCVYVDFFNEWDTAEHIVAYRPLPKKPSK